MKKYKKVISIGVVILIVVTSFLLGKFSNTENEYLEDKPKQIKQENLLSYYLENENGEYEAASGETWPTEGYKFNAALSKCENGGELGWDDTNKVVTMTGNMSDKCYIYFDIELPYHQSCNDNTLACYVAKKYTGTQGENNIYYHDGNLENGINDKSYRYAGANPDNYVCFASIAAVGICDNLFRIIGVIDGKVKLISATSIDSMEWDSNGSNTWSTATLNTYLNETYLSSLGDSWSNKIATTTWKVGGNTYANIRDVVPATAYQNEINEPTPTSTSSTGETEYSAKIGLMYVSDYGFAADPNAWSTRLSRYTESVNGSTIKSLNWMYMGINEWTISRDADDSYSAFFLINDGDFLSDDTDNSNIEVRPVFYLVSTATYASGKGTSTSPYRIN